MASETYLETYNRVAQERLGDYRRATAGNISWREFVRKWGLA